MTTEQEQQQQQQQQLYKYSSKIEMTAKGLAMVSVHVYSNDADESVRETVALYNRVINELESRGLTTAIQNNNGGSSGGR